MPDWRRLVSRRLHRLDVPPERRDEIAREMAGFLEDLYAERLRLGDSPRTARRAAIAGAGRWPDVVRALEREEGSVTHRLRTLWLPGLAVSVAAQGLLLALGELGAGGEVVWHPPQPPFLFFWPWLLALPLLGAAGAAWSRRQGGSRLERVLVAVFPVLAPWAVLFPVGAARVLSLDIPTSEKLLLLLVSALLNWVMLPAAALFLGALPLLRRSDPATPAA
jgi:hypothetical protein